MREAPACLVAFASASAATKYAAVSTAAGGRSLRSTRTSTGSGLRATSAASAASRPRSESTGGWMPRARSRSSRSASPAPSRASASSSPRRLGVVGELLLRHAEAHPERDEPRLRAVVQVALDPPQLVSGRVHRTGARRREDADPLVITAGRPRAVRRDRCDAARSPSPSAATPARSTRGSSPPRRRRRTGTSADAAPGDRERTRPRDATRSPRRRTPSTRGRRAARPSDSSVHSGQKYARVVSAQTTRRSG